MSRTGRGVQRTPTGDGTDLLFMAGLADKEGVEKQPDDEEPAAGDKKKPEPKPQDK